jgi:hypothetical protein
MERPPLLSLPHILNESPPGSQHGPNPGIVFDLNDEEDFFSPSEKRGVSHLENGISPAVSRRRFYLTKTGF